MSIAEVESMSGDELERWKLHFARVPFTVEMLDFAQAHICQVVAASMGGNRIAMARLLLVSRAKEKLTVASALKAFRAATG